MSGDSRYPGWCCRQIAAQLSQALFTMADLHAQVSDLREENRQLKVQIESIGIGRTQEVIMTTIFSFYHFSEQWIFSEKDVFYTSHKSLSCSVSCVYIVLKLLLFFVAILFLVVSAFTGCLFYFVAICSKKFES